MTAGARWTLTAVAISASAASIGLGLWQRSRLTQRRTINASALASRAMPQATLGGTGDPSALDQRRVTATGTWDHAHTLVLRGRMERESPGVHVVTPLLLDGLDVAVLVNRGFAPANDAASPDTSGLSRPARGTVHGIAFSLPQSPDSGAPLAYGPFTTWRRLDGPAVQRRLPYPILPVYLQESPDTASAGARSWPRPVAPPPLDDGPHLGYMIQWFAIAVVAAGFAVAVWRAGSVSRPDHLG